MKKHIASVVAVFVLLLIAPVSASSGTWLTKVNAVGAVEPKSVPGSINRGSGANRARFKPIGFWSREVTR